MEASIHLNPQLSPALSLLDPVHTSGGHNFSLPAAPFQGANFCFSDRFLSLSAFLPGRHSCGVVTFSAPNVGFKTFSVRSTLVRDRPAFPALMPVTRSMRGFRGVFFAHLARAAQMIACSRFGPSRLLQSDLTCDRSLPFSSRDFDLRKSPLMPLTHARELLFLK